MTTPIAPQPDPDINGLEEEALGQADPVDDAAGSAGDDVEAQVEDLNLMPDAPGPSGTGDLG